MIVLPIYEYQCSCCECRFELRRGFGEDGHVSCPECGADAVRIFCPVPIIFKGSGFYVTDSKNDHGRSSSKSSVSETKTGT